VLGVENGEFAVGKWEEMEIEIEELFLIEIQE
jgi:hypothetical protein